MKSVSILTTLVTATLFAASATIATAETTVRNSPQANSTPARVHDRPSAPANQLAAPGGGRQEIVTTCEGASSCNDFIALCAASGGEFTPTAHDGEGRPVKGQCEN